MKTIVEPKQYIDKLWGKQRVIEDQNYRLMRYILRVDHERKVLLHNVVTGQLVVLDRDESTALENLPMAYTPVIEQLVTEHYLVPEDYDEQQQVRNLRIVFRNLNHTAFDGIRQYTIFTTTACNARCYYCFEQGVEVVTMSKQTAKQVINFIDCNCSAEREVLITWFGGEPLVASERIDQICLGLREHGIKYRSHMISNGYLFNEEMISRARNLWNLEVIQISVDGTEENYNRIKSYVNPCGNPYQRVMKNVQLLIEHSINVKLRMNFDIGNADDFFQLVEEVRNRSNDSKRLQVTAYPVIGEYTNPEGIVLHGDSDWFDKKIMYLNDFARSKGVKSRKHKLPSLNFCGCVADDNQAIVIDARGRFLKCLECYQDDQIIGNIWDGITNSELVQSWKEVGNFKTCMNCVLYPHCVRMARCPGKEECIFISERKKNFLDAMLYFYTTHGNVSN